MTRPMTMTRLLDQDFYKGMETFDKWFYTPLNFINDIEELSNNSFTLPYNIFRNKTNNDAVIEVAVAGFSKEELKVDLGNGFLILSGEKTKTTKGSEEISYLHKGIAERSFRLSFPVNSIYEIKSVNLKNGLLTVTLKQAKEEETKLEITED